jgi:hypothetical protein
MLCLLLIEKKERERERERERENERNSQGAFFPGQTCPSGYAMLGFSRQ